MKRATVVRSLTEVLSRVHKITGILATPGCGNEAVRIKRIWVFGSTAKGATHPNDLDLLIDIFPAGRVFKVENVGFDKNYYRNHGFKTTRCSEQYALLWLTRNLKKISSHLMSSEMIQPDVKILVYPRNDMPIERSIESRK